MYLYKIFLLLFITVVNCDINNGVTRRSLFDEDLYEEVLNTPLCNVQLLILQTSGLILEFYDASIRGPRGILTGNLADWGNYHQCLGINQQLPQFVGEQLVPAVEGKYCSINVPLQQDGIDLSTLPTWMRNVKKSIILNEKTANVINDYENFKHQLQVMMNMEDDTLRVGAESPLASFSLTLGICIPKSCTTEQAINFIQGDQNLNYTQNFCRLPNDKPFSAADYVAISIFSFIGLLMIVSTCYDLRQTIFLKKGPKEINTLYSSFSVYTNTKRFLTFHSSSDALNSIDGIRAISILWIIVGHNFSVPALVLENALDSLQWMIEFKSIWLLSSDIAVDTFFMMSGLLVVYTTVGKITTSKFLKNLHLFYLLRYLRLFPLVAAAVLFQASVVHHMSDGPFWTRMATAAYNCQQHWWSTLLYIQNYVNYGRTCIAPTWYLSVDMQLYWISPIILVWLLGSNRRLAWVAVTAGVIISLTAGAIYNFINNFPSSTSHPLQRGNVQNYWANYYVNTLPRSPPFFVGMLFGYILHVYRGKKVNIPPALVILLWALATAASSFVIFIVYPTGQETYENQLLDNMINSFNRPLWAAALGWCIFACAHGYGGPINWFLSLSLWKLTARLSFALFLFHYPLILLEVGSYVRPRYFTVAGLVYTFLANLVLTFILSFIMTLAFDSSFSTLQKLFIGNGPKTRPPLLEGVLPTSKADTDKKDLITTQ